MINWKKLSTIHQLDEILQDSFTTPQVIFKHSTTCPISGMAKSRVEKTWDVDAQAYYLDLLSYRAISNAIADKLGVKHESPQIILIKDGKAIYDESHLDINIGELNQSLN